MVSPEGYSKSEELNKPIVLRDTTNLPPILYFHLHSQDANTHDL